LNWDSRATVRSEEDESSVLCEVLLCDNVKEDTHAVVAKASEAVSRASRTERDVIAEDKSSITKFLQA